jgi:flavin reductase (DIM6/NTAB) family NADH-FMN oxidoreductase RutF
MNDPKLRGPATANSSSEVDPRVFRRVMGRFATGVTVITAHDGGEVRGMTANAFMSGSLEPPLLVVSVAKRAHMHGFLLEAKRFGVNILAETQEDVSEHFAGRPNPTLNVQFEDRNGAQLLRGACARIAAEMVAQHDCGDHTIFIGRILSMESDDRAPLLYHAGCYRGLDREGRTDHRVSVLEFW